MEYYKFPCKPGDRITFDPEYDDENGFHNYKSGEIDRIEIYKDNISILVIDDTGEWQEVEEHESITVIK